MSSCTEIPAACQTAVDWMLSWNLTNRPSVSFEGMHPVTHGDAHVQIIRNTHMLSITHNVLLHFHNRADSRFAPSQWETSLQSNAVSHWLCANLESALLQYIPIIILLLVCCCDLVPADFSYVFRITLIINIDWPNGNGSSEWWINPMNHRKLII